jgi:hypothetical protein
MAGLQDDLASVFEEIGTLVEIVGSSPVVREYIDVEQNVQVSNPFIREHFIEGTLKAATKILPGSLLNFVGKNLTYLVVNHSPELFEDLVVIISTTLYKCNVVATVTRLTETVRDPVTRQITTSWEEVFTSPAPITSALRGSPSDMNDYQAFLQFQTKEKVIYFPEVIAPKALDRVTLPSGEQFKISNVEYYRFNGVVVCDLEEDTRA